MVVALLADEQGSLPLPWLREPLDEALAGQRGHALLLHASPGNGALPYALTLAQAWLCEAGQGAATRPCGHCGSCKLMRNHLHPDLCVLMPQTLRRLHEWPLADDKTEGEDSKKKPSKQIRIDEVRGLIDWAMKTSARGQGKVAVIHPADALNIQSANALLKTLEEPPPGTRIILTTADPEWLLPTVRSRCQRQLLPPPEPQAAAAWLQAQGLADADVLLAACSGRPLDALALASEGVSAEAWAALPTAVAAGRSGALAGWPVPRVLEALHKLCHDAMACASGGSARYFPRVPVATGAGGEVLARLVTWLRELDRVARHDEHPWNEGLLIESLVRQGAQALQPNLPARAASPRAGFDTLPR